MFDFDITFAYHLISGAVFGVVLFCSGVGAGVIVVPVLVALFSMSPLTAVGTGSLYAFFAKIAMTAGHSRSSQIHWPSLLRFLLAASPLTFCTAWFLGSHAASKMVQQATAIAILGAGSIALLAMFWSPFSRFLQRVNTHILSFITGVLMGITGVGGGIFVVPALTTSGGLRVKQAVATSIPIGLVLSMLVSMGLGAKGHLDWEAALVMTLGTLLSLPLGSYAFKKLSDTMIRLLASTMIAVSLLSLALKTIQGI